MIVPVQKDEELVRDFHTADNVTGALHLWWLGHSCFLIKWNGHGLIFDPYLSDSVTQKFEGTETPHPRLTERVVDPLLLSGVEAIVTCNTDPDHFDMETILPLRTANPKIKLVLPSACTDHAEKILGAAAPPFFPLDAGNYVECGPFQIHGIHSSGSENDDQTNLGFIVAFGNFAIYHGADSQWHSSLVKEIRRWPINLAFLPINGELGGETGRRNFNGFEAAALGKAISASLVIPCHYNTFDYQNADTEEFVSCCDRLNQRYHILDPGQRLTMGPMYDPSAGKAPPSDPQPEGWGLGY